MNGFPAVDPIPLPAPVWLFKVLHLLTLGLHFMAVQILLGGLLIAVILNFIGSRRSGNKWANMPLNAAASMAKRLPVVMTYVINLGVPPLLFTQVLYGRGLYTSSILIGVYWISVIFLLIACYWLIYKFAARCQEGRAGWWIGASAWLLAGVIARIYSSNMTLMLRPEVWNDMYSASAVGAHLPSGDPTLALRWLYMLFGGLVAAGISMIWLGGRKSYEKDIKDYFLTRGGILVMVGIPIHVFLSLQVIAAQPEVVRAGLSSNSIYRIAGEVWLVGYALIFLTGLWAFLRKPQGRAPGSIAVHILLIAMLGMVTFRDGIRDLTLAIHHYDVWDRVVVTNWPVVAIFLVTFVAGLAGMVWLISVMVRSKPVSERVTS